MKNMDWKQIEQQLSLKLKEPLPGTQAHLRMLPRFRNQETLQISDNARESGVLILLYPNEQFETSLVLIQRSDDGGSHSGQIALPGGKRELEDVDIVQTALREANEEVNLETHTVHVIGQLSPLYINVSNFVVHPIVALSNHKPILTKSDFEVSRILYPNLGSLFASKTEEKIIIPSTKTNLVWQAPVYKLEDHSTVWGATAMILSELELVCDTLK